MRSTCKRCSSPISSNGTKGSHQLHQLSRRPRRLLFRVHAPATELRDMLPRGVGARDRRRCKSPHTHTILMRRDSRSAHLHLMSSLCPQINLCLRFSRMSISSMTTKRSSTRNNTSEKNEFMF